MELTQEQRLAVARAKTLTRQRQLAAQAPVEAPQPDFRAAGAEASAIPGDAARSGGKLEAGLIGARQGVTFGFGDEINAGVRAAADALGGKPFGEAYDERLAHERGLLEQTREENPVSSAVGTVGGAVLPGLLTGGTTAATAGGAAIKGGAAGAASGAAYGLGEAEGGPGDRLEGAAKGAALGGLFGAGAGAAINVGTRAFRAAFGRAVQKPTIEGLREAKTLAYKAVDDAGEVFSPEEVQGMAQAAREAVESSSTYVPDVDKQTEAALTILDRQGAGPKTLGQLDNIRKALWKRYNAAPNEVGILDAIDAIDNLVATREASSDLMQAARAANSTYKKAELLEAAFKKARDQTASTGSGGNILNKYRQAVTNIVNDPKRAKWFSGEELETMQKMIDGGTGIDLLRRVGKLSPDGNGLMLALNLLGGAQFGPGALAVTGLATGAKAVADNATRRMAERTLATVAGAAPEAARPVTVPGPFNALLGLAGGYAAAR